MKKIQIRDWWDDHVLYETEVEDDDQFPVRTAVNRASLVGARLDRARLDGARLDGARLDGASLVGASLDGASLDGASLDGANLDRANLDRARLDRASLVGASLDGASLDGANLDGANLDRASLDGASLDGASLDGANLDRARLDRASLENIRSDLRAVLDLAPNEVLGLLGMLRAGKIDGTCYEGECACLIGTIANIRHCSYKKLGDLTPNASRAAERWFLALRPECTPQLHPVARITERWILEWMQEHNIADPQVALKAIAQRAANGIDPVSGEEITALGRALIALLP